MNYVSDDGRSSTFGRELMNYISQKLPYTGNTLASVTDSLNPKYKYFQNTGTQRAEALSRNSVTQSYDFNNQPLGTASNDKRYNDIMYANIQKDKPARIRDYRVMAAFAEVSDALDEICDETINVDNGGVCIKIDTNNINIQENEKQLIINEFNRYINYFDLNHKGWEYFRQLLVEGEIYWEHIIHKEHVNEGVLGVILIPSELIDPVYSNIQNILVKGYLYRKPKFDPNNPLKQVGIEYIPMDKNQVTYVHSHIWNENKTMRLPFLENSRRAYRQLSLIEDAIVIYRLVRAPERLVFNVDVGNMPAPKAEAYLRKLMQNYWSSKTFDVNQAGPVQKMNPQSMLDSFWFAKRAGSEGTSVISLPGGQNLGELADLMYFVKKLYKSLKVPTTRLDPEDAFRDGADMLREELKFAKFIIRLQQQFAEGLKNGFITHLQFKGMWKQYNLKEQNINLTFNVPTNFYEVREAQRLELKVNNFNNISNNQNISPTFALKKYMGWSDIEIKANREFLRKDKAFAWELSQIEAGGPNWQNNVIAGANATTGAEGMEGAPAGGGGMPPAFTGGPAATAPEGTEAGMAPGGEMSPETPAAPAPEAPPTA
jgi:hypothetical protein